MLKTISAALVATALVAGTAFAAQPSAGSGTTTANAPAAATQATVKPAASKQSAVKQVKTIKHASRHVRHHNVRSAKPGTAKAVKAPA